MRIRWAIRVCRWHAKLWRISQNVHLHVPYRVGGLDSNKLYRENGFVSLLFWVLENTLAKEYIAIFGSKWTMTDFHFFKKMFAIVPRFLLLISSQGLLHSAWSFPFPKFGKIPKFSIFSENRTLSPGFSSIFGNFSIKT